MTISAAFSPGEYTAVQARQAITAGLAGTSSAANILPRNGVIPDGIGPFAVSASSGMTVSVKPGQAAVSGWIVTSDAAVQVTLATSGAQARTDLVIIRILDQEAGDGASVASIESVTGQSTAVPAVPLRSFVIAQISVGANVSTIASGNITDKRVYTAAAGGIVPIPGAFAVPELAAGLVDGTGVWDASVLQQGVKVGAAVRLPFDPFVPRLNEMELYSTTPTNIGTNLWNWLGNLAKTYESGSGFTANSIGIGCNFDGRVQIEAAWNMTGSVAGNRRIIGVGPVSGGNTEPSGFNVSIPPNTSGSTITMSTVQTLNVSAGDVMAMWAWHDSGTVNVMGKRKLICRRVG